MRIVTLLSGARLLAGIKMQEDRMIIEMVGKVGPKRWSLIAQQLPGRIGKQCRERCAALLFAP